MIVYLNNNQVELSQSKSITDILTEDFNIPESKGLAVAVNQEVIPKANWSNYLLKEQDKLTIIRATQGG